MRLVSLIASSRRTILIKSLSRLIPLTLGLAIIGFFLQSQPLMAERLVNQALIRLDLTSPPVDTISTSVLLNQLNSFRTDHQLAPLESDPRLDQIAQLITLSTADQSSDTGLSIDKLAAAVGYSYQDIAYLTAVFPLPLVQTVDQSVISKSQDELLDKTFTHTGLYAHHDPKRILFTMVLARPAKAPPAASRASAAAPSSTPAPAYTGVELWDKIQQYRREHGVPEFKQDNTLCTLTSIRLNQLIQLGRLDNHDGFEPLVNQFRDQNKVSFGNLAENILQGYPNPDEALKAWDSSLGHQALLKSGAYVWACASANHGYAVLIAAY